MPDFVDGYMTLHEIIRVAVTFDGEGRVKSCDAQYGSSRVRQMTCDAIMRNWRSVLFAGRTVFAYINYGHGGPVHVTLQPPPPYPGAAVDRREEGQFVLNVTFDETGRVSSCRVASGSAPQDLTEPTCAFITRYWQSKAHAGQTVQVPINFVLRR